MKEFDKAIAEIYENYENEIIIDIRSRMEGKKIVIFGAGELGHKVFEVLKDRGIGIAYFCDNYLKGKTDERTGLKIAGMEELTAEGEKALVLIAVFHEPVYHTVYQSLLASGFSEEQLINTKRLGDISPLAHLTEHLREYRKVYSFLEEDFSKQVYLKRMQRGYLLIDISPVVSSSAEEYFDKRAALSQEEVFVDCGGFVGDTSMKFIGRTGGRYKKIIILEPEESKQGEIRKNMGDSRYDLYRYGAWSCNTALKFDGRGDVGSCVSEKGKVEIEARALDEIIYEEKPTFIKMDIEGAEVEALKGSEKIIKDFKPKLAICVYHKPEDLFEIPILIKEMRSDYQIFIRQYDNSQYETVCYAV